MRVYPAVLERAITAGLLLLPLSGVLLAAGQEGDASLLLVAIALASAVLYGSVVWLIDGRRRLGAELSATPVAPDEAVLEPLGRTALRGLPALVLAVGSGILATRFDALAVVLVVLGGYGLSIALQALTLRRAERREAGRLVRDPDRSGALLRF